MISRALLICAAIAACAGFSFAAVSTSDFVAHLDRQVHAIHCSFVPGADQPDVSGTSGCAVTLMSPYSSVLRDSIWGGIPVSLPAMAVFAYLVLASLALVVLRRDSDPRATAYVALSWCLPFLTSLVMGWLALHELDAACKLCIGIYISSTVGFVLAIGAWISARNEWMRLPTEAFDRVDEDEELALRLPRKSAPSDAHDDAADTVHDDDGSYPADATVDPAADTHVPLALPGSARPRLATASELDRRLRSRHVRRSHATHDPRPPLVSFASLGLAFGLGVALVSVPVIAYAASAPDFDRYLGACGTLASPGDPSHVLVPIGPQDRDVRVIEVFDPLCPACRGLEQRFSALPATEHVARQVLLFPLDSECNWMVDSAIHPGACAVSEAVLCASDSDAGPTPEAVIAWAFAEQASLREEAERDPQAPGRRVREHFPALSRCIGDPRTRQRLNLALRWAVANQLPVLTPQLYVGGTRVCDGDTDLGLDWALTRLVDRAREGR